MRQRDGAGREGGGPLLHEGKPESGREREARGPDLGDFEALVREVQEDEREEHEHREQDERPEDRMGAPALEGASDPDHEARSLPISLLRRISSHRHEADATLDRAGEGPVNATSPLCAGSSHPGVELPGDHDQCEHVIRAHRLDLRHSGSLDGLGPELVDARRLEREDDSVVHRHRLAERQPRA